MFDARDSPTRTGCLKGLPISEADELASAQVKRLLAQLEGAICPKLVIHRHLLFCP